MSDDFDPRDGESELFDEIDEDLEHDEELEFDDEPDDDEEPGAGCVCVIRIGLAQPEMPHPGRVAQVASKRGLTLVFERRDQNVFTYRLTVGGSTVAAFVSIGKQTLPKVPIGPTSITNDERETAQWTLLVTAPSLKGRAIEIDSLTARFAGVLLECSSCAVGVLLDHGTVIHKPRMFSELARIAGEANEAISSLALIDVTRAYDQEDSTRLSLLTHNLPRYGCANLYVTCRRDNEEAPHFVREIADWRIEDPDENVPNGDTIGRSDKERVPVKRVRSPTRDGTTVWKLDLP